jgi:DNA-directed RNA polymerase specialized sigma54-like protein
MLAVLRNKMKEVATMTHLLDQAFSEAAKLPARDQDLIAGHILEELHSETYWQQQLDSSQDALKSLAEEALAEHKADRTEDLDPSQ